MAEVCLSILNTWPGPGGRCRIDGFLPCGCCTNGVLIWIEMVQMFEHYGQFLGVLQCKSVSKRVDTCSNNIWKMMLGRQPPPFLRKDPYFILLQMKRFKIDSVSLWPRWIPKGYAWVQEPMVTSSQASLHFYCFSRCFWRWFSFAEHVYAFYESSENHGEKSQNKTAQKHPEARHFRSFQHSKHVRLEPRLQFEGGLTATTGADETWMDRRFSRRSATLVTKNICFFKGNPKEKWKSLSYRW